MLIAAVLAWSGTAPAETWPVKPVRFVVGYAPGSSPDIACRIVSDGIARHLGQQVVVENRPGAGNVVAAQLVAHAPADGYTMFFAPTSALVINPFLIKNLPYDPQRNFVPVGLVGRVSLMILVNPDVPAKTLPELVALAKREPGHLSFASDGPTNMNGLLGEWLNRRAGTKILQVPYAQMPQGVEDTLAGRTQIVMLTTIAARPLIKSDRLRPIAVSTAARVPGFDDVPAVADTYPGFDLGAWYGVMAPAGTPAAAVHRVNEALHQALAEPAVAGRLHEGGLMLVESVRTSDEFAAFIAADRARWREITQTLHLQPE